MSFISHFLAAPQTFLIIKVLFLPNSGHWWAAQYGNLQYKEVVLDLNYSPRQTIYKINEKNYKKVLSPEVTGSV